MVKTCCWGDCKTDSRKDLPNNVSFIGFGQGFPKPNKDREKCLRWVENCGRKNFTIDNVNKDTYICSLHFVGENGPTVDHPDPIKCDKQVERKRRGTRVSHTRPKQTRIEPQAASPSSNCEFCRDEAVDNDADGFCVDCKVHLCETCIAEHRRNRVTRPHVVQTALIQKFLKQMQHLENKIKTTKIKAENFDNPITLFNEGVNSILEEIINKILQEAKTYKSDNTEKVERVTSKCQTVQSAIIKLITELKDLTQSANCAQHDITMAGQTPCAETKSQHNQYAKDNRKVTTRNFFSNKKNKKCRRGPVAFGTVSEEENEKGTSSIGIIENRGDGTSLNRPITTATFVKVIQIERENDTEMCYITGFAFISEYRLVITDLRSRKVKLVDTRLNKTISEYEFQEGPTNVCCIGTSQVAVTLTEEKNIVIFNVTDEITKAMEINVDGKCYGICYSQNQLIVIFEDPPKLELISLDGDVTRRRIDVHSHRNILGGNLCGLCVSIDGEIIYVINRLDHTVICLTKEGVVKSSFTGLTRPWNGCVDHRGNMFVCDDLGIHMIDDECKKIKQIQKEKHIWFHRTPISHCRQTDILYVGGTNYLHNIYMIQVYQLS